MLSLLTFFAACGQTNAERLAVAGRIEGEVRAFDDFIEARGEVPADCRRTESAGVTEGDRLDVAVLAFSAALGRQNARTVRCMLWVDDLVSGYV